jgi:hypothetical protein
MDIRGTTPSQVNDSDTFVCRGVSCVPRNMQERQVVADLDSLTLLPTYPEILRHARVILSIGTWPKSTQFCPCVFPHTLSIQVENAYVKLTKKGQYYCFTLVVGNSGLTKLGTNNANGLDFQAPFVCNGNTSEIALPCRFW